LLAARACFTSSRKPLSASHQSKTFVHRPKSL
jgi:hypothetical protein